MKPPYSPMFGPRLLLLLVVFRVLNALVVRTYFTPDEFWQGPEVAHFLAFSRGHLTWEWLPGARIRGFMHPLIFAGLFKVLAILGLDTTWAVAHSPKLFQGVLAGVCDYFTFGLTLCVFGQQAAGWALLFQTLSWFNFYCLVRPYSNSAEACLAVTALYFWAPFLLCPNNNRVGKEGEGKQVQGGGGRSDAGGIVSFHNPPGEGVALLLAALCVAIRPTSAAQWAVAGLFRLSDVSISRWPGYLTCTALPPVVAVVGVSVLVDSWFYGAWTLVPERFLRFNVIEGGSRVFGEQAWHWNFTQGLPAVLGVGLPPALWGARRSLSGIGNRRGKRIVWLVVWFLVCHSFSPHKEFRFLLPILPLAHALAGEATWSFLTGRAKRRVESSAANKQGMQGRGRYGAMATVLVLVSLHVPTAIYLSTVHQRGPLAAVEAVARRLLAVEAGRTEVGWDGANEMSDKGEVPQDGSRNGGGVEGERTRLSVHFLMPCHSTPLHSHLHLQGRELELLSLDCSPSNRLQPEGSESDRFQADPLTFVKTLYGSDGGGKGDTNFPTVVSAGGATDHAVSSTSPTQQEIPDMVVVYDTHLLALEGFLATKGLEVVETVFNTHMNGDADSDDTHGRVCILARREQK
ncbi:unnamed protein product [Choristocarpus tenellus]